MLDTGPAIDRIRRTGAVARIRRRDHTLWPHGESGDLGWLDLPESMPPSCPGLSQLASQVAAEGVTRIVLLGMGGSSLAPLALASALGPQPGFPELTVLDSTVPSWVRRVSRSSDPTSTLYVVSSKSGDTTETDALYRHFRDAVETRVGKQNAGSRFVAVTDPGSPLEDLARRNAFRAVFLDPPGVVGRYSALSYFGLVPAALAGLDASKLLQRAARIRLRCGPQTPLEENPGVTLGAAMAHAALNGRDKLTLLPSPSLAAFGLWVEQLVAESTGKQGKGIVPVSGEPLMDARSYAPDRLFVYLRLDGASNADADEGIAALEAAGHPVLRVRLVDAYDLGAEFFRWEFATALAAALLGVYPFNQPDVELTKRNTRKLLAAHAASATPPSEPTPTGPARVTPANAGVQPPPVIPTKAGIHPRLGELLAHAQPGHYLAIMAYVDSTPAVDEAIAALRQAIAERHGIATTMGYGPRFLHSTGQLHKGGPNSGLFLQLTAAHLHDLPIPGTPHTFGALTDLQAQADLAALQSKGRTAVHLHLGANAPSALYALREEVSA